jgi:2'-5' RNA ligase
MRRIFIAIRIEPQNILKRMISELKSALKDDRIKWTDPGNFHVTLAFLGETEEDKIKEVAKMLARVCPDTGEFVLVLKGAGVFKSINDPRVLWTGIDSSEKLGILFESVKNGLKGAGIALEDRNFNPHLTLGRIKNIKDKEKLKTLIVNYRNLEIQKQEIREVILYESVLLPAGPVYKPLGKFALDNMGRGEEENGRLGA